MPQERCGTDELRGGDSGQVEGRFVAERLDGIWQAFDLKPHRECSPPAGPNREGKSVAEPFMRERLRPMFPGLRRRREQRRRSRDWRTISADIRRGRDQRQFSLVGQEAAVAQLEALLFRHDPIGINFETNTDEYRSEAETITLRRGEVSSVHDLLRVIHEEFVHWFDEETAGPEERYQQIACELGALWFEPSDD